MQLTEKERSLLKDLKGQESLCIEKYSESARRANDPALAELFSSLENAERQHLETLAKIEQGEAPQPGGSSGGQSSGQSGGGQSAEQTFPARYFVSETPEKKEDCFLCTDLLAAEKHASHLYDTCVFEFREAAARDALAHIQQEEQQHGKKLYDYMKTNAMYS